LRKNFSALFIAVGFHQSYALGIEGEKHPDVVTGINFLRKVALKEKVSVKEKVLVIGGGNTAVDTARTALRLGARVTILYRRTRNEMPAIPDEVEELLEEGIPIEFLTAPVKIYSSGGRIAKVECIRMKLGEPDSTGRARPLPIEGSNFLIDADQIFTAIGESADTSFLPFDLKIGREGIIADEFGRTNLPRVFAGGDVATGAGTVCAAIGSGRKTAIAIQKYLQAEDINSDDLLPPSLKGVNPKIVTLKYLNTDYIEIAPRVRMKLLSPLKRKNSFTEIHRLLTEKEALFEAQRCISCGTCPQCDNCYIFCPDNAVQHSQVPGEKYIIDIKHCKGCGLCVAECPRFCLELHPVH
jgi:NADPH-dependent glutamate synthase beta subunit-like oxidoreductase